MNAHKAQPFRGRFAELSPLDIKVAKLPNAAACKSTASRREVATGKVPAVELYGCVDWYQYPGQAKREPEAKVKPGAGISTGPSPADHYLKTL